MSLLAFTSDNTDLALAYHGYHDMPLVLLSLLIAVQAAYTSFSHRSLIQHSAGRWSRWLWLSSGATAMGLGVWAMHFTGMMSLQLPVEVSYQLDLTLVSVVPAIAAAYITLQVVAAQVTRLKAIVGGGVLMGSGIGCMHYVGMAAMQLQAERLYQPLMFVVSILVAVVLATLALGVRPWLSSVLRHKILLELISSVVMGLAIASMHYVAMHATVFMPLTQKQPFTGVAMSKQMLGTLAVIVAVGILLVATIAVIMRQRIRQAERSSDMANERARLVTTRLERIASRVPGLVYEFHMSHDGHFTFPYASDVIYQFYRLTPQQAKEDAMPIMTVVHPDDREVLLQSIYRSAQLMLPWQHEFRIVDAQNAVRWLLGNAIPERDADGVSWSGFTTDITLRKEADEKIHQLAYFDALTGLFNRRKIQQSLQELCEQFSDNARGSAVILVDVDNFKRINDTQGHKAGDELLKQVAARLLQFIPPGSVCGRLSSDEFVVLVSDLPLQLPQASRQLEQFASELRQHLQQPYAIGGHHYSSSFSIGYSVFNDASVSADDLLKQADIAVSHAKAMGGNCQYMFAQVMKQRMQHRFALERALDSAVERQELSLHYQPQVTDNARVIGVEALLRWHNAELGLVSPAEFIPLAEETGQIEKIGLWVLQQACQQLSEWHADPLMKDITMSVNISARQFYLPEFVTLVKQCLEQYDFAPHCLMLELTESLILADIDDAISRMQHIKQLGVKFSMDDFGTGYSSLSYLSRLPFDEVKIDQFFIRSGSSGQPRDWVIIDAIIGIANTYGMKLVAEGVETETQRDMLRKSGCRCYQGYLYAKPAPASQTQAWIMQRLTGASSN
jgi:diguanylate cyclase